MRSIAAKCSSPTGPVSEDSKMARALRVRLRVLLHRHALDRELARGEQPFESPELLLRSRQLTCREERRCLTCSLKTIVEEAEGATERPPFSLGVPIHDDAVLIWRDSILAIARRLENQGPVTAAGMARIHLLLTDGAGPLSNPRSEYLMADVVPGIEEEL